MADSEGAPLWLRSWNFPLVWRKPIMKDEYDTFLPKSDNENITVTDWHKFK